MKRISLALLFYFLASPCFSQTKDTTHVLATIMKSEWQSSKVMDIVFQLTDVNGPRLTGSPGFMKAAQWVKKTLENWGIDHVSIESWGQFGRGWQQKRTYIALTKPYYQPFIAIPKAWTGNTPGTKPVQQKVVLINAKDSIDLIRKYKGQLTNSIIMVYLPEKIKSSFKPDATRLSDSLLDWSAKVDPKTFLSQQNNRLSYESRQKALATASLTKALHALIKQEKPLLILSADLRGNNGTLFVEEGGTYDEDDTPAPANVVLASEDYLKLQRLIESGTAVEVEADVKNTFSKKNENGYNVVAEILGSDPKLADEIVMLGAHLDSWHGATGATDNAAGCAVMLEVVRLIRLLNLKPKRTIRLGLWGGEEQGLYGSRGYVKRHFSDSNAMQPLSDHNKVSAYYNLDNGGGKIRGVYLQGNDSLRTIFSEWLKPFKDLGAATVTILSTKGSDHQAFDEINIPAFQFIQDPLEYDTRTHHTNMDTYDHLLENDLKQAVIIIAAFVYNTAQLDTLLPRKVF